MGRNSASQIHWAHGFDAVTSKYAFSWYCQQHAKTDKLQNIDLPTAFATLKTHLITDHGLTEQ